MSDKQSEVVLTITPDNWGVLQYLFLGQDQPTAKHPKLDNWDVLQVLFGISKSSPEKLPVDSGTSEDSKTDPKPPTNEIEVAKLAAIAAKTQAEAAQQTAIAAQRIVEALKTEVEAAQQAAVAALRAVEAIKAEAEAAQVGAKMAQQAAEVAKTRAEAAQVEAEMAQQSAVVAQKAAETFKTEAEAAKTQAEMAKAGAQAEREAVKTALEKVDVFPTPRKTTQLVVFLKQHGVKLLLTAITFMLLVIFLDRAFRRKKPLSSSTSMIYIDPVNRSDRTLSKIV